jgi:hypothetical protein
MPLKKKPGNRATCEHLLNLLALVAMPLFVPFYFVLLIISFIHFMILFILGTIIVTTVQYDITYD